ncbi:MAG: MmcQ/YjbR family DNA-binding protein [Oscillospiraceae bacterium]|nr:MmcQ/YjbR family DNA-binding protein [Oscillospiraceae bacterium]
MNNVKDDLILYVKNTYHVKPDHPFSTVPNCSVFRHSDTRKWFALMMDVSARKLGLGNDGQVDLINLKCSAALAGVLRQQTGFFPGYHMHHDSWISILLDGTVPSGEISPLIDLSYTLTSDTQHRSATRSWLIPANPKYYDLETSLRLSPDRTLFWKQSAGILAGDTVYIYMASPVSAVKYKCKVMETDIPRRRSNGPVPMDKAMRIKVQKTYRKPIPLDTLKSHGVHSVRSARYVPESLLAVFRASH